MSGDKKITVKTPKDINFDEKIKFYYDRIEEIDNTVLLLAEKRIRFFGRIDMLEDIKKEIGVSDE